MTDQSPALSVPIASVLDEYVRMNTDLTMTVAQLRVLLAEKNRELGEAHARLAAPQQVPPYDGTEVAEFAPA